MDDSNEDPRLPHRRNPNESVSLDQLAGDLVSLSLPRNPTNLSFNLLLHCDVGCEFCRIGGLVLEAESNYL